MSSRTLAVLWLSLVLGVAPAACSGGSGPAHGDAGGGAGGRGAAAGSDGGAADGAAGSGGAGGAGGHGGAPVTDAGSTGTGGGAADASIDVPVLPGILTVVSVSPAARSLTAAATAPIVVHFDRPVSRASVTSSSFWAFGRWSGPVRNGSYAFSDNDGTVTLSLPASRVWSAGDRVTVVLSHALKAADGTNLRGAGYSFQFWTATAPGPFHFVEVARLSTRTNGVQSTTYGASVADVNGDGYLDLLTVNEDSADLRIFLNKGDGSGQFLPFVQPTTPLDIEASPSETTDFNGDGITDLVTSNAMAGDLSILLGKGDGTFMPTQKPQVGAKPRGVAVLDVDGDGDMDIVNTNSDDSTMSLLLNDGTGHFPTSQANGIVFFDAGHGQRTVSTEYGLMTGDMNEDGIMDLVIGAQGLAGQNAGVVINTGNGDGTFSFASLAGPSTDGWQVSVGDLNKDGHEDVGTADNGKNTMTTLLGAGAASVQVSQTLSAMLSEPTAIDFGDLDGDGDLDVVVSSFTGLWALYRNDGTGHLTLESTVTPTSASSCAVLLDIDNDRDLDLVLIDENADQLIVMRQM
jgi:FG-GAP-like repeat/Bacterial Ig-like domain